MSSDLPASDAGHWAIPQPGPRPPPGPERTQWNNQKKLHKHRADIHALLDSISPKLRNNVSTSLSADQVSLRILEHIEQVSAKSARAQFISLLLAHLQRGFRSYCREHRLPVISLPLIGPLAIDEGLLDGDLLANEQLHRQILSAWTNGIRQLLDAIANARTSPYTAQGAILVSAAIFGGLVREKHWAELLAVLKQPLPTTTRYLIFNLGDGFSWIADPVTESLLRRFSAEDSKQLPDPRRMSADAAIRPFTQSLGREESPSTLLANAGHAFLVRRCAPDIASIALGHIANTSLPEKAVNRIIHGLRPTSWPSFDISLKPTTRRQKPASYQLSHTAEIVRDLKAATRWDVAELRDQGLPDDRQSESAEEQFRERLAAELVRINYRHAEYCANRGLERSTGFTQAAIWYVEDLLHIGGPKQEKLAPSSIDGYTSDLLARLTRLEGCDLREVSTDQRQAIYAAAMVDDHGQIRRGMDNLLRLFERTLLTRVDVDDEVDWSALPCAEKPESTVDANFIDPATYAQLMETLASAEFSHEVFRDVLISAAILLYRFGLRRGEAHEVTIANIHWVADGAILLRVRPLRLTRLKTHQAARWIGPVILPPRELEHLKNHVRRRTVDVGDDANSTSVYLFARPGKGSALFGESVLFDPLVRIVRWLSGDDSLRIRHFRHAFGSRLFLCGRCPEPDLDELSHRPATWRDAYAADGAWLRTFEMGHLSPLTAIQVYAQTNPLAHYFYAATALPRLLDIRTLSGLAGLGERSLERDIHRHGSSSTTTFPVETECFLAAVRRRWLRQTESGHPLRRKPPPPIRMLFDGGLSDADRTAGYVTKFADLVGIVNDRLRNSLSLSSWESRGVPLEVGQRWVDNTVLLTGLGLFEPDYARRFQLRETLIERGDDCLGALALRGDSIGLRRLLIRALIAMRGRHAFIRLDPSSAERLIDWFHAVKREDPILTGKPVAGGRVELRLSVGGTQLSGLRMFLLLFAVHQLSADDLLYDVKPYLMRLAR